MKLKNVAELRRRAKAHRRMRNFLQIGYGSNAKNGDPNEIRACAMGCLAAPHQKGKFAALMKRIGVEVMWDAGNERERLAKEFGICEFLAFAIEGGFESNEPGGRTQADRADFVVAVTEALADGVDIQPRDIRRFTRDGEWWPQPPQGRIELLELLAEKCGRPIPAYARKAVTA